LFDLLAGGLEQESLSEDVFSEKNEERDPRGFVLSRKLLLEDVEFHPK
jgi:hypothetical protein